MAAKEQDEVLSVVIPVYNEAGRWRQLLARVEAVDISPYGKQVILVEDGSTDGTREELRAFEQSLAAGGGAAGVEYLVLLHARNRGKGAALRTGFAAATGEWVIVQDADLEYSPADYPKLLATAAATGADAVYGSRFSGPGNRRGRPANYLANRLLTFLSNRTTGLRLTDMETCYKLIRRSVLETLDLRQDRFGFEPEITARLAAAGVKVAETPIRYEPRSRREGKKIGLRDGLEAIECIWKYRPGRR